METEAYLGLDDPASHAFRGRRHAGNLAIYGPPGSWYVYRSYGIHWCANLVTGPVGHGAAVLQRGLLVVAGHDLARTRRGRRDDRQLTDGPGKLTQALAIDRTLDGRMMGDSPVRIFPHQPVGCVVTPRVGITKAVDWPLRFLAQNARGAAVRPPRETPD